MARKSAGLVLYDDRVSPGSQGRRAPLRRGGSLVAGNGLATHQPIIYLAPIYKNAVVTAGSSSRAIGGGDV